MVVNIATKTPGATYLARHGIDGFDQPSNSITDHCHTTKHTNSDPQQHMVQISDVFA